jgi:ATP cone domain
VAATQSSLSDLLPGFPVREETPTMQVRKRNGSLEPVDVNKIVRAVQRCSSGLSHVEPMRIASKTIGGLYNGATTRELDTMSINTAASLIAEDLLSGGVAGLSVRDMRQYPGYVGDSRLQRLGLAPAFHCRNPFSFMDLQDRSGADKLL